MKKFVFLLLILCIAFTAVACSALEQRANDPVIVPSQIDLDLTDELAQKDAVLAQFKIDGNVRPVGHPREAGMPYIPEGAECTQLIILQNSVTIGYTLRGVRYTVDYMENGVVTIAGGISINGEVAEYFMTDSATGKVEIIK